MNATTLRVVTLNLQHGNPAGVRPSGDPVDPGALLAAAAELRDLRPDVVLLQEVDRGQARSGYVDQAAVLGRALGMPTVAFAAAFAGSTTGLRRAARRAEASRGYGVAVLARQPAVSRHVHRMPGGLLPRRAGGRWRLGTEPRVCLALTLLTPLGPLTVASTHLAVETDRAQAQLAGCEAALCTLPGPHLLGGDLNLQPDDVAPVLTALRPLGGAPTFTNTRPRRQIDHLLGSAGLDPAGPATALHLPVSDHAGLSVELRSA